MDPEPKRPGESRSCLNSPCQCPAEPGGSYCSDPCRAEHRDGALTGGPCHCDHAACPGS